MRMSQNFTKTRKEAPADESARNAQLLIRAGYVYKVMAGVYAYTPLGLKVIENIKQLIRDEMDGLGSQELLMTSLQNKKPWETTGRWDEKVVDVWFKSTMQDGTEVGFGWSHEEAILEMLRQYIASYNDFPISVYQFQTKLRNELRAKSGIMRGREFLMKDMYSLHATEQDMNAYYDKVIASYNRIFDKLGIGDETYITFASGGAFTKFSHEFQTVCDAGEDVLYVAKDGKIAVNEEVLDEAAEEMGINKSDLKPVKTAEIGNIFKFGTDKSEKMKIYFTDKDGKQKPFYLASYGIGVSRLMGVLVEKFSDDKGIVWPEIMAPYRVQICRLGNTAKVVSEADSLYELLQKQGAQVLYDDRDIRAGEMLSDADLIGVPHRIVVSEKTIDAKQYEYKARTDSNAKMMSKEELLSSLAIKK